MGLVGVDAKKPKNLLFFVAPVTSGIDAYSGEFASFTPAFDSKGGDAKDFGYLTDGEKIG